MRLPYHTECEREEAPVVARLGLVILQTDEVIESEFPALVGLGSGLDGVRLHYSRVPSSRDVTPQGLAAMEAKLPAAVELLPPGIPFDVIAFACTSGATFIGEAQVEAAVQGVRPGIAVTNPLSATKAALKALGMEKIGFVTPYVAAVSAAMRDALASAGFETVSFGSFEVVEDGIVARMTPACILDAVIAVGEAAPCDGVFVACTNLRAAGIIEEAEKRLAKPVVTSNQALAWHMLRLAGYQEALPARGRLFLRQLTAEGATAPAARPAAPAGARR